MTVTSADVAKAAGVSRGAVSQILNGRGERFSVQTRERVKQIALELNYQPSAAARTLARGASEIVVALIPNTTFGSNLQDLYDTLTDELSAVGFTLVLRLSTSSSESFDRLVRTMHPFAVSTIARVNDDDRRLLQERGVHLIEPEIGVIEQINYAIGRMQAQYLIDRGRVQLAYAHLRDSRDDPFGRAREEGVRDACLAHGLPDPEILNLAIDLDEGRRELSRLRLPGPGIACYNDDVALALMSAALQSGWKVPADLALIGADNTPVGRLAIPRLTTIDMDFQAAAQNAVRIVLSALLATAPAEPVGDLPSALRLVEGATA